jgi:hypothetical protein
LRSISHLSSDRYTFCVANCPSLQKLSPKRSQTPPPSCRVGSQPYQHLVRVRVDLTHQSDLMIIFFRPSLIYVDCVDTGAEPILLADPGPSTPLFEWHAHWSTDDALNRPSPSACEIFPLYIALCYPHLKRTTSAVLFPSYTMLRTSASAETREGENLN